MKTIKAKVHRLPTENPSLLAIAINNGDIRYVNFNLSPGATLLYQHLYFTTDEEIKVGDWFYNPATKGVLYASKEMLSWNCDTTQEHKGWKKIIASTDPKLNEVNDKNKVDESWFRPFIPKIPQSFIEEYCKAGGIDEVLVEGNEVRFPLKERMGIEEYEFVSKLNPHNTIIIHSVEEKMYSRDEVEKLIKRFYYKDLADVVNSDLGNGIDKWIEENL